MTFLNAAHKTFYEQTVAAEMAETNPARMALFYTLGLTEETRRHIEDLYDFRKHVIKETGMRARWQRSSSRKVCCLAFNLYNGFCGRSGLHTMDFTPWRVFDSPLRPYFYQAIDIRFSNIPKTVE